LPFIFAGGVIAMHLGFFGQEVVDQEQRLSRRFDDEEAFISTEGCSLTGFVVYVHEGAVHVPIHARSGAAIYRTRAFEGSYLEPGPDMVPDEGIVSGS
jgi:hypothetical protein